jgi:hypothetical protein
MSASFSRSHGSRLSVRASKSRIEAQRASSSRARAVDGSVPMSGGIDATASASQV